MAEEKKETKQKPSSTSSTSSVRKQNITEDYFSSAKIGERIHPQIEAWFSYYFQVSKIIKDPYNSTIDIPNPQYPLFIHSVHDPVYKDFMAVLSSLSKNSLQSFEEDFLKQYYHEHKKTMVPRWTEQVFLKSANIIEIKGLATYNDLKKSHAASLPYFTICLRIASRICCKNSIQDNIKYVHALIYGMIYCIELRKNSKIFTQVRYWETLALNSSMFIWFEKVLKSWGLHVTSDGLTTIVHTGARQCLDVQETARSKQLWQDFCSNKKRVRTFALLVAFLKYGRSNDLTPVGQDEAEWGKWTLPDSCYIRFLNDPLLEQHKNHRIALRHLSRFQAKLDDEKTKTIDVLKNTTIVVGTTP